MDEKICATHEDEICSICFFERCSEYLLCNRCIKRHPDNHELNIKSIMTLMRKDDWIKSQEEQRDTQISHIKYFYQARGCLLDENRKKLQDMTEEIIGFLRKRLSLWTEDLENLLDSNNQESNEILTHLQSSLHSLENINFREGDIYDKVDKAKLFNESTLPNSREFCNQIEESMKEVKIDQNKLDSCKKEIIELLESIHLKELVVLSKLKRQNASEQLNTLQQKYENFQKEKNSQIEKLAQNIELLEKNNNDCQAQLNSVKEHLNHLTALNIDYKQKIESQTITNQELKEEVSVFKAELDTVVDSKLKLHKEFEIVHNKLIEKEIKSGFLSEDSLIIQAKDVNNIKAWVQNPVNTDKPGSLKLDLLCRATRDGFLSSAFYEKCSSKSPTITFIKSKEYGRVFGGYTTKNWENNNKYIEDKEAFLFSLTHQEKYPIKHPEKATYAGKSSPRGFILSFGAGHDIAICEGCNTSSTQAYTYFPYSYECAKFANYDAPGARQYLAGSWEFTVEEIEVYQVVWLE